MKLLKSVKPFPLLYAGHGNHSAPLHVASFARFHVSRADATVAADVNNVLKGALTVRLPRTDEGQVMVDGENPVD